MRVNHPNWFCSLSNATEPKKSSAVLQNGFTLIEIIIGMLVLSVALVIIYGVLTPQTKQGIDPIWQVKAVALANSLSNEVLAKSYDQNSNPSGNLSRCDEGTACTSSAALGPDTGETRLDYNDVDDYHGFSASDNNIMSNSGFTGIVNGTDLYSGFQASITVFYDGNLDGINDDDLDQNGTLDSGTLTALNKLIQITITTPGNEQIVISSIKGNF